MESNEKINKITSCPPARLIDALRAKLVLATPQVGHDDGRKRVMLGPDVVEMENVTLATTSNLQVSTAGASDMLLGG
jgi:hypothetical protein